ncbi:MAG: glycosyltransferase [Candidatus Cloacimonas sp.]
MKILIIPSWYPYPKKPYAGKFFIEQAKALSENSNWQFEILNWGQNEYQLQIRHPKTAITKIFAYLRARPSMRNLSPNLKEICIPHLTWTNKLFSGNIKALTNKLDSLSKPDLIHSFVTFPAGFLAMHLAQKWKVPYLITEHSGPFPFPEFIKKNKVSSQITFPMQKASAVIAVSSFLQHQILASCSVKSNVIPNLVDTEFYKPQAKTEQRKRFSFFSLSALTPSKGVLDLVEAFRLAVNKGMDADLYLGGSGYLAPKIRKLVIQYHLENRIHLLGYLTPEQSVAQYNNCNCYILPSHLESFSMVLLEAMACGIPSIATNCGGPKDILSIETGVLIPPKNPEIMADTMLNMIDKIDAYSSNAIRDICLKRFSPAVICSEILRIYANV